MTNAADPFADYAADLVKTTDPSDCPIDLQMMTFFGRSGTGKTSVASKFKNHIYLDLEASATEQSVNAWPQEWGRTWVKFADLIQLTFENKGGPLEGKTLVIDPVSELWEMCYRHVLAPHGKTPATYNPGDDYAALLRQARGEFSRVMQLLLRLRMEQRMGVIFIAHEIVTEAGLYEPKAGDKMVSAWVAEKVQMILRFSIEDTDPLTGKPWADAEGKPTRRPNWIIRTTPLKAADVVKDRTERLPPFVLARHDKLVKAYGD